MKLRGLRTLIFILIALGVVLGYSRYGKSPKNPLSNDRENELTQENSGPEGTSSKPKNLKEVMAANLKKQEEFVERKDFEGNLVAAERFYTENEINSMTEEEFQNLVKETERKLPKSSDIKKLPAGALHHTPVPVLQAGKDLGLLKEVLKVHESYDRVAAPFYERCAKNADVPTPVRALCLTNLIQVKKKYSEKINIAEYPNELVELSKMVTDL